MPGGDGTGPMGYGPATGWGRRGCRGFAAARSGRVAWAGRGFRPVPGPVSGPVPGMGDQNALLSRIALLEERLRALEQPPDDSDRS